MIKIKIKNVKEVQSYLLETIKKMNKTVIGGIKTWFTESCFPLMQQKTLDHKRTEELHSSLGYTMDESKNMIRMTVTSNKPYAIIQDVGGTVKARAGSWLTVPLPDALDDRGVARPARAYRETFVQKSKLGNLIIFQKRGPRIVPLFVLKKQVKIPGFKYATESAEKTIPQMGSYIEQSLSELDV